MKLKAPMKAKPVLVKKDNGSEPSKQKTVLKRPAVASKSLQQQCEDWKVNVKGNQHDPDAESDAEGDGRDKGKGRKFAKMKDQLPAHTLNLYDVEAVKHESPRQFRTVIINKLFKRT